MSRAVHVRIVSQNAFWYFIFQVPVMNHIVEKMVFDKYRSYDLTDVQQYICNAFHDDPPLDVSEY